MEEKEALLLALGKAEKLDKSACLVCTDVIAIDSTSLACPMYCYCLLLCGMHYSRPRTSSRGRGGDEERDQLGTRGL